MERRKPSFDLLGQDEEVKRIAAAVSVLLALTACTPGPSASSDTSPAAASSSDSPPSASGGRSTPASGVDLPPRPPRKACYRMRVKQLTKPTNSSDPVACRLNHNAQTIFVGRLHTVIDGHDLAVDSDQAQKQVAHTCPRKLASYVGGDFSTRALSRFEVVWFTPTLKQSDEGAKWFRCDLVAFSGQSRLAQLPPPRQLKRVLDDPDNLDQYGLCGTAAPGAKSFQRVICSRRHSWRAISIIHISDQKKFPGIAVVREAGESACKDQVRQIVGSTLKFQYGWEWPTRAQWNEGQHHGFCWAPD